MATKALYLPDQKRILLDKDLPKLKHRWNEAHEVGHNIIPWHVGMMLGDTEQTLTPACHEIMEAEANCAAGQLLFLSERFLEEAASEAPTIDVVQRLSGRLGNTITSTMWRLIDQAHRDMPLVALVSAHPHPARRKATFDPANPCRYCIQSPLFRERFGGLTEIELFAITTGYAGAQRGGPLGQSDIILPDRNGSRHSFRFETFFNGHEALTIGVWQREMAISVSVA